MPVHGIIVLPSSPERLVHIWQVIFSLDLRVISKKKNIGLYSLIFYEHKSIITFVKVWKILNGIAKK